MRLSNLRGIKVIERKPRLHLIFPFPPTQAELDWVVPEALARANKRRGAGTFTEASYK